MIFITGGTGFLGAHLLWKLCSEKENIRALYRSEKQLKETKFIFSFYTSEPEKYINKIEWVQGDLMDYDSFSGYLNECAEVYHTAAVVDYVPGHRRSTIQKNIKTTENLVNACLNVPNIKLCYASSIAALGEIDDPITEETSYDFSPNASGYSVGKYYAEMEVWRGIAEGLNAVMVNPSVILGPGNWHKSSTALFKTVFDGLRFYTEGTTGYVDVRDVSDAMILLMEKGECGQRFLLNSENLSYQELFTQIANGFAVKAPYIKVDPLLAELVCWFEHAKYKITGKAPLITKETARISQKTLRYSGQGIVEAYSFEYMPVSETIKYSCDTLKKSYSI